MGGTFVYNTSSKQYTPQSSSFHPVTKNISSKKRVHSEISETHTLECTGCGRTNHLVTTCHFASSPYLNKGGGKYSVSAAYTKLKKERPTWTKLFLPRGSTK